MKTTLLFAAMLLLIASGCKKSVEGETKNWDANVQNVKTLQSKFPGFKAPLQSVLDDATRVMDESRSMSDEAAKIAKMADANAILGGGWVSDLSNVDSWKKNLRDKVTDVNKSKLDEADRMGAQFAINNADRILNGLDRTLQNGASDRGTAESILRSLKSEIDGAITDLGKVMSNVTAKQNQSDQDKKVTEDKAKAEEQKLADWKCAYCDKMNAYDAKECAGCGAAH